MPSRADTPPLRTDGDEWHHAANRLRTADHLLLVSDFDGTLAPIREDPTAVAVRPDAEAALAKLAAAPKTDVAVVSGRALADVRDRVGIGGIAYAGDHGFEIDAGDRVYVQPDAEAAASAVRSAARDARERLADVDGAVVEEKDVTATVHYRQVDDESAEGHVREVVRDVTGEDDRLRVTEGKQIREIRPDVDWDKGRAVTWIRDELGVDPETSRTVYVGDDVTDEAAFRVLGEGDLGIHVGDADETAADYRVPDQATVADLLGWIAEERAD